MKYLLTLMAIFAMVSCSDDDNNDNGTATPARHTIIIYMAAENSLSSLVQDDINEITTASNSVPKDVNIVAFIDPSANVNNGMPYIASFKNGKMTTDKALAMSEDAYACDPSLIAKTLNNIIQRYKAESYSLILWGHASGWLIENDTIPTQVTGMQMAYGMDNGKNTYSDRGKWINIPTLASTLESTGIKFDIIMADCCCFQSMETAYEMKDVADYIIGSPAEIPGAGAPYHLLLPIMAKNIDTEQKCISMTEQYYQFYVNRLPAPMSVIKTDKMQHMAEMTRALWHTIKDKEIVDNGCTYYFMNNYMPIFYDAQEIAAANCDNPTVMDDWLKALDEAIIFHKSSREWDTLLSMMGFSTFSPNDEKTCCVSMYLPMAAYSKTQQTRLTNQVMRYKWGMAVFGDLQKSNN